MAQRMRMEALYMLPFHHLDVTGKALYKEETEEWYYINDE
jgi:hypothetical protein